MTGLRFIIAYTQWHFEESLREIFEFWKNLAWFGYHFFSISLLLKTLFRPIFRVHETARPGTGLNMELFFENININIIARVVGFFLRIFLLICGGIYQIIILSLAPVFLLLWIIMPIIPFILVAIGIQMAF